VKKSNVKQNEESVSFQSSVAIIGFAGGVIWSLLGYLAYFLNFTKVGPSMILMPWALGEWKHGQMGHWIGILVIGVISIGVAFLYRILLARVNKYWPGIFFGAVLWFIVFGWLHPLFENVKSIFVMDLNTLVTTLSLYVLYGLFIGYSISYEYYERTLNQVEAIQD